MANLLVTAGTKLFIGPAKAYNEVDFTAADFTTGSPVWILIGGVTNLGGAGDTSELVTSQQLGSARLRKGKGTRNAGVMQVVLDLTLTDPGQIALVAAEKSPLTYAFKIEFPDAPPPAGKPSIRYLVGLVMAVPEQWDEANSVMKMNATIELEGNIVRVPLSAT